MNFILKQSQKRLVIAKLYEYLSTVKKLYLLAKDTKNIEREYVTVANDFLLIGPEVKNSIPQVIMDMMSDLCPKDTPSLNLINEINNKEK